MSKAIMHSWRLSVGDSLGVLDRLVVSTAIHSHMGVDGWTRPFRLWNRLSMWHLNFLYSLYLTLMNVVLGSRLAAATLLLVELSVVLTPPDHRLSRTYHSMALTVSRTVLGPALP